MVNIAYNSNSLTMELGQVENGIKPVADRKTGKVLGVHIVGYRATKLIAEPRWASRWKSWPKTWPGRSRYIRL